MSRFQDTEQAKAKTDPEKQDSEEEESETIFCQYGPPEWFRIRFMLLLALTIVLPFILCIFTLEYE
jgi:hypothetical protein